MKPMGVCGCSVEVVLFGSFATWTEQMPVSVCVCVRACGRDLRPFLSKKLFP